MPEKAKRASFLPCPLLGLTPEGVAQIKEGSSHLKRSRFKVGLPISDDLIKKNPPF